MMMLGIPIEKPFPSTSENKKNTLMVIQDWQLGPEQPSNERGANADYWRAIAKTMQLDEAEARRRRRKAGFAGTGPGSTGFTYPHRQFQPDGSCA